MTRLKNLVLLATLIAETQAFSLQSSVLTSKQTSRQPRLHMAEDDSFWTQQRDLMEEMTGQEEKSLRKEQLGQFAKRRSALITGKCYFEWWFIDI